MLGTVFFNKILQRAVGIADADDILPGLYHAQNSGGSGSHTGSEGKGRHAMLQSRNLIFQNPNCGILHTTVNICMLVMGIGVEVIVNLVEHIQGVHKDGRYDGIVILFVFFTIVGSDHLRTAQIKILFHISFPFQVVILSA